MTVGIDGSQLKAIRTAGFMYLLMTLTAPFSLLYVPSKLIVSGNAAATADNIRNFGSLLRLGIAGELFHQAVAVFLVLALYRLFRPVNEDHAKLLVVLGALVSVPIMFLNVVNELAALTLTSGASFLSRFEESQLNTLAYLFLRLHGQGITVAEIFWGLWLFPFGILVIRSRYIPRLLGILLFIAGSAYLADSFTSILLPQYEELVSPIAGVLEIGELPIVLWFIIIGIRRHTATGFGNAIG